MKMKIVFFIISLCLIVFLSDAITDMTGGNIQMYDGTIYKKEILPEEVRLYKYIPMRYRIYIENNVEVHERVINKKAYYDVTEETFSMYSIGDWFDAQNPKGVNYEIESAN